MSSDVIATVANMRKHYREARTVRHEDGPITVFPVQPFAFSYGTGERYSANPGDYFMLADDEPLRDSEGEPMVLAFEHCVIESI
jgi:hypothetical protein